MNNTMVEVLEVVIKAYSLQPKSFFTKYRDANHKLRIDTTSTNT